MISFKQFLYEEYDHATKMKEQSVEETIKWIKQQYKTRDDFPKENQMIYRGVTSKRRFLQHRWIYI
jgi:hypothetical protein